MNGELISSIGRGIVALIGIHRNNFLKIDICTTYLDSTSVSYISVLDFYLSTTFLFPSSHSHILISQIILKLFKFDLYCHLINIILLLLLSINIRETVSETTL